MTPSAMKSALFLLLLIGQAVLAQNPYNEKAEYARSRTYDLQHLKLELAFDLSRRELLGTATLRMAPLAGDLREVALDSAGLKIESITEAGRKLDFRTTDQQLFITLTRQYPAGRPVEFVIRYTAQPKRGLFFVFPDKHHPNRPKQIWADGDTAGGNNRYWFPGYDFPNDKTTTEMLVTVPSGWKAVSNGRLAGEKENAGAGTVTFHWVEEKPMSTYLVSLVAGEFDEHTEKWKVPVEYYVPRGKGGDITAPSAAPPRCSSSSRSTSPLTPGRSTSQAAGGHFRRRHGEHQRHHRGRLRPPGRGRLRRPEAARRRPDRARDGPPVVRRPGDLCRLAARLAERGIRHLFRRALAGARARDATSSIGTNFARSAPSPALRSTSRWSRRTARAPAFLTP